MSLPLSVCVIARDEEERLARCLRSAAFASERIVVLDERAPDVMDKVASEAGARVVRHPYRGNIAQKNVALGLAREDWVLALDADESLTPELALELRERLREPGDLAGIECNRVTRHLGREIRHGDFFPDWQLRVFRRQGARFAGRDPHGRVELRGRTLRARGELVHESYRDLADQLTRIRDWGNVAAERMAAEGRRASATDLTLRPLARFLRGYLLKAGFRDGRAGFVIAAMTGVYVFYKYARLWELSRR